MGASLAQKLEGQVACVFLCAWALGSPSTQIRYWIPEELEHGAFVGNIAEDLGFDVSKLSTRRFRIISGARKQYLDVSLESGILFVNEKIDREELCEQTMTCSIHLQVVIENPFELYQVEIEILDMNDNSPSFPWSEFNLDVSESAAPGSRYPLESAQDQDQGTNSLHTYLLSVNGHFVLEVQGRSDGSKFPELVLQTPLDRERQTTHYLVLTAVDGGKPARSGTAQITVTVLDANDHAPVFDQTFYHVRLMENAPRAFLVIKLNASDMDEGANGEISYSLSGHAPLHVRQLFSVDSSTGEIRVKGTLDYERARIHEIYVQAKDKGPYAVAVHCKVLVSILDMNDNLPEVILTSVTTHVQEDAAPGTVIAVISLTDRDSGDNGNVECEITEGVPFQLRSSFTNYYTLITSEFLDRETVSEYNVTLTARDFGIPPLSTSKTVSVQVSDINDNAPRFLKPSYSVYVPENNAPGASIGSVSALDSDSNQNAYLSYSVLEDLIHGMPVFSYVSINSDNGNVYALRSFDHELLRNFKIRVQAVDAGFPPLSSNVTINVFVVDQNDNAPVIVSPLPQNGTVAIEKVPRSIDAGYLVAKITAVDIDAGQNSRLSYHLVQATDSSLFSVALYTGEIRTIRRLLDKDDAEQRLVILVTDSGQPPLSATVSVILSIVDNVPGSLSDFNDLTLSPEPPSRLSLYLTVSLGSVSGVFLLAILLLAAVKAHRDSLSIGACCTFRSEASAASNLKSNLNLQMSTACRLPSSCSEAEDRGPLSRSYCYKMCLTPNSARSGLMFLKLCSPVAPRKKSQNRGSANTTSIELKQPDMDYASSEEQQNTTLESRGSVRVDGVVLPRGTCHSEACAVSQGRSQYWSCVCRVPGVGEPDLPWNDLKMSPSVSGVPFSLWTPRYAAAAAQPPPEPPPDYEHSVNNPSCPCSTTWRPGSRPNQGAYSDLQNSFSTFGKNRRSSAEGDAQDTPPRHAHPKQPAV